MSIRSRITPLLLAFSLGGCTPEWAEVLPSMAPEGDLDVAAEAIRRTQDGEYELLRASFHQSVTEEQLGDDEVWSELVRLLQGVDLASLTMIGVNVSVSPNGRMSILSYEGESESSWVQITVRVRDGELFGLNIVPMDGSLVAANAFQVGHAGLRHALLLIYGLGTILLAGFASYRSLTSNIKRRRLWAVLSFLMVGKISLVWTTGSMSIQPLQVLVPPIAALKAGPAAPWILSVGVPLFAIIALRKVAKAKATTDNDDGLMERAV